MVKTNGIYAWCRMIAFVSVISAVVMLIVPENRIKKVFSTFMAVLLIFSLLQPLNDAEGFYELFDRLSVRLKNSPDNNEIESYGNLPIIYSAQSETEKHLNKILEASDVNAQCSVTCSVKDNTVCVDTVTVNLDAEEGRINQVVNIISEICSDEAVIIINGEIYER